MEENHGKAVCFIPARGGSKRIVNKNISKLGKKSLLQLGIELAESTNCFDKIIVSSDSDEILSESLKHGSSVSAIKRSSACSSDSSSTEDAIIEWLANSGTELNEIDLICLLQLTSPFTHKKHIEEGYSLITSGMFSSVIGGIEVYPFIWKTNKDIDNIVDPLYDPEKRPRTQEMSKVFIETGAFYFFKKTDFMVKRNRIVSPVGKVVMDIVRGGIDINDVNDLELAQILAPALL